MGVDAPVSGCAHSLVSCVCGSDYRRGRLPRRQQQEKATRCVAVSNVFPASGASSVLRSAVNPVARYVTCGHSATGHHHHHHHLPTDQCGHRSVKSFCTNSLSRIQHWSTSFGDETGPASVASASAVAMDDRSIAHSCAPLDAGTLKLAIGPRKAVVMNEREAPCLSSSIMTTVSLDLSGKVQHPSGKVQHPSSKVQHPSGKVQHPDGNGNASARKDIGPAGTVLCTVDTDPAHAVKDRLSPSGKDPPDKRDKDLLNERGKNALSPNGRDLLRSGGKVQPDQRGEGLPGLSGTATGEELSAGAEHFSHSQRICVSDRLRRTLEKGCEARQTEQPADDKDPREEGEDMEQKSRFRTDDRGRPDANIHGDQLLSGTDAELQDDDDDDDDDRLRHPDLVIDSCVKRALVV